MSKIEYKCFFLTQSDKDLFLSLEHTENSCIVFVGTAAELEQYPRLTNVLSLLPYEPTFIEMEIAFTNVYTYFEKTFFQHYVKTQFDEKKNHTIKLNEIGIILSKERDIDKILETILYYSCEMTQSDAGSIYIVENNKDITKQESHHLGNKHLRFKHTYNFSNPSSYKEFTFPITPKSISGYCILNSKMINVEDAYNIPQEFPYKIDTDFDKKTGYRTKSMLTIPMLNNYHEPIGVVQLINKKTTSDVKLINEDITHEYVIPFNEDDEHLMRSLSSQAAIVYENQLLFEEQKILLDALVELLANAIDKKSPYTGKHCSRVPVIATMLTEAVVKSNEQPFQSFSLNKDQWREIQLAAWLHDCGKIVTPIHVMDKSTKLEGIFDKIEMIRLRFEILLRETYIKYLKYGMITSPIFYQEMETIKNNFQFVLEMNQGQEFMDPKKIDRMKSIAATVITVNDQISSLISDDELYNLSITKGTLNAEEREIIDNHIVVTIEMLEKLPFPKNLSRVPEYAGGHHEKMDGTGYPFKLKQEDLAIPTKIMIIADVFEALTSVDRPYKQPLRLSEAMNIMGKMKRQNHFDVDLFNLFIKEKVYLEYAKQYIPGEFIDEVNEEELIDIVPSMYDAK